ncbi:MAG: TetR/AcrR family transcriptional regulator [Planctomycetota bacterium]
MTKRQPRVERRRQILRAARKVFARKGFAATRMIDIAGAASSGKGTLYEYFGSKESLFSTLLLSVARDSMETMASTVRVDDPAAALGSAIDYVVEVALVENFDLYRLYLDFAAISVAHRRRARAGIQNVVVQLRSFLADLVRAGQRQGAFRPELDAELVARSIGAAVDGLGMQLVLFDEQVDLGAYAGTLKTLYLGALGADAPLDGASILKERK